MEYFSVKNFDRLQHYKDRDPIWIKLYRDIWRDIEFFNLSDTGKLYYIGLLTIASETNNKIPLDERWIQTRLGIVQTPDIKELIDAGFAVVNECSDSASNLLAGTYQPASVHIENREQRTEKTLSPAREENSFPEKSEKLKTPFPEDFTVTAEMENWSRQEFPGCDIVSETNKFLSHHKARGTLMVDWVELWKGWIQKSPKFQSKFRPTARASPHANDRYVGVSSARASPEPKRCPSIKPEDQPKEWFAAREILQNLLNGKSFDTWILPILCRSFSADKVELEVPSKSFVACLKENYMHKLLIATGSKEIVIEHWRECGSAG